MLALLALRSLVAHRRRALLLLGVAAGAGALLATAFSVQAEVTRAHRRAVTTLISGDLNVGGFFKAHPDAIAPVIADARPVRSAAERVLPTACSVRERGRGTVVLGAGQHRLGAYVSGIDVAREAGLAQAFELRSGSMAGLSAARTVALSEPLATRLSVGVGDLVTLFATTVRGERGAVDAQVVAVTGNAGLLAETAGVVMSNATLAELAGYGPNALGVLQIMCDPGVDLGALAGSIREALGVQFELLPPVHEAFGDKVAPLLREAWAGQRLDVSSWEDEGAFLSFVTDGLAALTFVTALTVLGAVLAGLFVFLSVSVRERTREIGTLRALGMARGAVVAMVLMEGAAVGLGASALGLAAFTTASWTLGSSVSVPEGLVALFMIRKLELQLGLSEAVRVVCWICGGAAAASIVPAARAAALQPRLAMEAL